MTAKRNDISISVVSVGCSGERARGTGAEYSSILRHEKLCGKNLFLLAAAVTRGSSGRAGDERAGNFQSAVRALQRSADRGDNEGTGGYAYRAARPTPSDRGRGRDDGRQRISRGTSGGASTDLGAAMLNIVGKRVYLACGHTDMRKSINGLSGMVEGASGLIRSTGRCSYSATASGTG